MHGMPWHVGVSHPSRGSIEISTTAVCIQVHRVPHVGVLSTGDELVEPDAQDLAPGKIRDANRSMLIAAAQAAGARVTDFGIAADNEEAVEAAFAKINAQRVDVLLTTGSHHALTTHSCITFRPGQCCWPLLAQLACHAELVHVRLACPA